MFGDITRWCGLAGLSVVLGASGCRGLNPAFEANSNQETHTPAVNESSSAQTPLGTEQQTTSSTTKQPELLTSTGQDPSHARPQTESLTSSGATITSAATTSSSSISSSSSGTGTGTGYVVPEWNEIEPKPATQPAAQDLCNRGAKGCFVFYSHTATQVESQTPQYPGFYVTVNNGLAPSQNAASLPPPLKGGVRLDSTNSSIQSLSPYPRYEGQDFGIEIWYRSDPNPNYDLSLDNNNRATPVMLVQILKHIWLQEDPRNGGISCAMTTSTAAVNVLPHAYQVGPSANPSNQGRPRDQLRVAACAISNSKIYLWSNGVMEPQHTNAIYQVSNVTDQKIAFGGWVTGNAAANNFQALQGTIYMVRIWNNINYMRDAMVANLTLHQGSIDDSQIAELGNAP